MDNRLKVSVYTIFEILVYVLAFADIRNNILKYGLMVVVGIFLVSKVSHQLLVRNKVINLLVSGFTIVSLLISFQFQGVTNRNPFLANIVFCGVFIEFVLMLEVVSEQKGIRHFLKTASICAIVICAAVDILAFTVGASRGIYLIGTKFQVVYHHMLAVTLYMVSNENVVNNKKSVSYFKNNLMLIGLGILTIIVSIRVDCSTGIIGTLVLLIFTWIISINRNFFARPVVFIGAILLGFAFMWGFDVVLSNKQIIALITVYLQRSVSLTGRTIIYSEMTRVMKGHWLLGFGYGSTYEICRSKIGFADTQNALMEWIMQIGIIGTGCLLAVLIYAFSKSVDLKNENHWIWLAGYIFTLIFIGTVEITYTMYFFSALILIYILGVEKEGRWLDECVD